MAGVSLRKLVKRYGDTVAVAGVDLEIRDQEFLVLVGPSGCGKSTTLRMIAGLEEISEGEIWIGENKVNDVAPGERDIAMVFQNYALYPHWTVFKNMAFGLKLRKTPSDQIKTAVLRAAKLLGIEDYLQRKPKALSGGQRQRVAMGRAIVRNPRVFLFDEPLSNLDAQLRVQMRLEISRLHGRLKTTVVYVTHDQVEAMTLADRIVVMDGGKIQQAGTPMELYNRPANRFVAGFLGSPAMNFIEGRILDGSFVAGDLNIDLSGELQIEDGSELTLGFRPHDVHLVSEDEPHSFEARVELIEQMGSESFLHVNLDEGPLVIRQDGEAKVVAGSSYGFQIDRGMAHFFMTTGETIERKL